MVVPTLTARISRLKAIDPRSNGAFESCDLAEYSNNILDCHRCDGAVWRLVEDDNIKLTKSIKGISAPASADAVILD